MPAKKRTTTPSKSERPKPTSQTPAPSPRPRAAADKNPRTDGEARSTATRPSNGDGGPSQEDIRRRAYELYEQRGRQPGHEREDWLRAERELRERRAR